MFVILLMLGAGAAMAAVVIGAMAYAGRQETPEVLAANPSRRDAIAASLLFQVLRSGEIPESDALRQVRRATGLAAPVTAGVDVASWAEAFARTASVAERAALLETAVRLVAVHERLVPLFQYATLLDLSFGLGFQTDALARLRETYGFEYVDPAKAGRPPEADRFSRRSSGDQVAGLLALLEVGPSATRQEIIASYRRLAAQHHPDRHHHEPEEAQADAAARFIEITHAYEELLRIRD